MNSKLTAGMVLRAAPAPGKDRLYVWDTELRGFGLMVMASRPQELRRAVSRRPPQPPHDDLRRASGRAGAQGSPRHPRQRRQGRRSGRCQARRGSGAGEHARAIGDRYLASRAGRGLRTIDQRRDILERLIYPKLGGRPIESIRRSDVARLLEQIGDQRGPRMAGYAASVLKIVFHWFEKQSDDFRSPMIRGMAPNGIVPRDRVLTIASCRRSGGWRALGSIRSRACCNSSC